MSTQATSNSRKPTIAEYVTVLAEAYRKETSPAMFRAYEMGLSDLPMAAIDRAVQAAIRTKKFMPTVAELRELTGEVRVEQRAVLAFGVLDAAVKRHGCYTTVHFDDPFLNAALHDLGGWEKVCDVKEPEWFSFFRKRFLETYEALATRGAISAEQARPLPGYFDRNNAAAGFAPRRVERIATGLPKLPVRIGHEQPRPAPKAGRIEGPQRIGDLVR